MGSKFPGFDSFAVLQSVLSGLISGPVFVRGSLAFLPPSPSIEGEGEGIVFDSSDLSVSLLAPRSEDSEGGEVARYVLSGFLVEGVIGGGEGETPDSVVEGYLRAALSALLRGDFSRSGKVARVDFLASSERGEVDPWAGSLRLSDASGEEIASFELRLFDAP